MSTEEEALKQLAASLTSFCPAGMGSQIVFMKRFSVEPLNFRTMDSKTKILSLDKSEMDTRPTYDNVWVWVGGYSKQRRMLPRFYNTTPQRLLYCLLRMPIDDNKRLKQKPLCSSCDVNPYKYEVASGDRFNARDYINQARKAGLGQSQVAKAYLNNHSEDVAKCLAWIVENYKGMGFTNEDIRRFVANQSEYPPTIINAALDQYFKMEGV